MDAQMLVWISLPRQDWLRDDFDGEHYLNFGMPLLMHL